MNQLIIGFMGCQVKMCSKCAAWKLINLYTNDRRNSTGLQSQCEDCRSEAKKKAHKLNPKKAIDRMSKWRIENPDRAKAQRRKNYDENRDKYIRKSKEWVAQNPERRSEINRQYNHRRRCITSLSSDPPTLDFLRNRDGDQCYLCDEPIMFDIAYPDPLYPTIDHKMPLSRCGEHSKENTALAHHRCNVRKQASTPEEYFERITQCVS